MKIVVLATTRLSTPQPFPEADGDWDMHLVSLVPADVPGEIVLVGRSGPIARLGDRLSRLLGGSPPLRMLRRTLPIDGGARFWRAVKSDRRVWETCTGAALLVAADRDSVFAAWQLARRIDIPAVSGLVAATTELKRRRNQ